MEPFTVISTLKLNSTGLPAGKGWLKASPLVLPDWLEKPVPSDFVEHGSVLVQGQP
jgi:hypothetical protein